MDRSIYEACGELVEQYGRKVSADEILSQKINNLVPIPFKSREDLELAAVADKEAGVFSGDLIPQIDLKVLHYYATQLIVQKYPHLINCFDETALITLGLLVEKWVNDYLKQEQSAPSNPAELISKKTNYRQSPSDI
ncbi:LAME_0C05622g1_1 [Lachancea meyersii CBS 8951]|uniref:LAME_0C05622g1_1 n=1 Tax=Lachancea meyersii CBS 8951 TaxID=1266667 RepID=A0A1G4J1X4_9SACH|nr:LAME_0C05622g1_1 [Lachancea meyersii CBS 8951]